MNQEEIMQQLQVAVALHNQGELDQAEAIYWHSEFGLLDILKEKIICNYRGPSAQTLITYPMEDIFI